MALPARLWTSSYVSARLLPSRAVRTKALRLAAGPRVAVRQVVRMLTLGRALAHLVLTRRFFLIQSFSRIRPAFAGAVGVWVLAGCFLHYRR